MGNIVVLDELTINQIAAGEVIERPASVIKEMIENSIDAGSKNITVEIKNGGISFIRITDNGKGIAKDDIELAFERHATSKIRTANDLSTIKSMGFRGEALASIAAIANVELVSKTENEEVGNRIVVEGGEILSIDEIGCSKGTTITVRNLFFNTPVRYKFLKKDFTESGYIEDVITRIAVVHPEIAIKFINTGKTILQTNGSGDLTQTVYSIFGKEIASNLIDVDYEYEYMKIKGVIGKTNIARSNRSNQIFFVNKRYIKDKTISSAVEQAYKGLLPIGKFAFLILNIEMPPSKVDVNVHPAKLEVRFEDENIAFKAIFHSIKDTLLKLGMMTDRERTLEIKEASKNAFKITNAEKMANDVYKIEKKPEIENIVDDKKNDSYFKKSNIIGNEDFLTKPKIENIADTLNQPQITNNVDIFNQPQIVNNTDSFNQPNIVNNENGFEQLNTVNNKDVLEHPKIINNEDVFEQLKKLQNELQKEVENNPNLQLTDKYKEMEKKYNDIILPVSEEAKNKEQEISKDVIPVFFEDSKENLEKELKDKKIEEDDSEKNILTEEKNEENQINKEIEIEKEIDTYQNEEKNNDLKEEDIKNINEAENKENIPEETKTEEKSSSKIPSFEEMYRQLFGKEPYGGRLKVESVPKEKTKTEENFYTIDSKMEDSNISLFENQENYKEIKYKFIGIAFNTYIILEIGNEMYIMDQHAAHERVMYEKVKKNFERGGEGTSQMLLLPDIINLTHKEMDIAKDNFDLFRKAGFILEEFGENTIRLSGVPEICIDLNTEELFKETLDEINTVARTAKQEKEEKFLATVACKAAVKANMVLQKEEVDSLMEELLKLPNPFTCPHGRPTIIKMSKYEIERKFARK